MRKLLFVLIGLLITNLAVAGAAVSSPASDNCGFLDKKELEEEFDFAVTSVKSDGAGTTCVISASGEQFYSFFVNLIEVGEMGPAMRKSSNASEQDTVAGLERDAYWTINGSTLNVWTNIGIMASVMMVGGDAKSGLADREKLVTVVRSATARLDARVMAGAPIHVAKQLAEFNGDAAHTSCLLLTLAQIEAALNAKVMDVKLPNPDLNLCSLATAGSEVWSVDVSISPDVPRALWDLFKQTSTMPNRNGVAAQIEDIAGLGEAAYLALLPSHAEITFLTADHRSITLTMSLRGELKAEQRERVLALAKAVASGAH